MTENITFNNCRITTFSNVHGIFAKIDHTSSHKTNLEEIADLPHTWTQRIKQNEATKEYFPRKETR